MDGTELWQHVTYKFLCACAKSLQSCLTLCNPMDCSPPGCSVHGILQARILEWVAISFSGDLSTPGIQSTFPKSPASSGEFFITSVTLQKINFSTQSPSARVWTSSFLPYDGAWIFKVDPCPEAVGFCMPWLCVRYQFKASFCTHVTILGVLKPDTRCYQYQQFPQGCRVSLLRPPLWFSMTSLL